MAKSEGKGSNSSVKLVLMLVLFLGLFVVVTAQSSAEEVVTSQACIYAMGGGWGCVWPFGSANVYTVTISPPANGSSVANPVRVRGIWNVTAPQGNLNQYHIQIQWGDGNITSAVNINRTTNGLTGNDQIYSGTYDTEPISGCNASDGEDGCNLGNFSHNYTVCGPFNVTVKLYHSTPPGTESGDVSANVTIKQCNKACGSQCETAADCTGIYCTATGHKTYPSSKCDNATCSCKGSGSESCVIGSCGAKCTVATQATDCVCPVDGCVGSDYYDYPTSSNCINSGANSCLCNNSTSAGGGCVPAVIVGDPRCVPLECETNADCNDSSACTTDTCSAENICTHTPINCNDSNVCNGTETCNPATGCVAGTPLNCDDADSCTADTCDPSTGCAHNNICGDCESDADCNDSIQCTHDACIDKECFYTNETFGTPCGLERDCEPYCNNPYMIYAISDGHDYCDGNGTCIEFSCNYNSSVCNQSCSAQCDEAADCAPKQESDYCYYDGACNATCNCTYKSEYCPPPGTIINGTCYYGNETCTRQGCGVRFANMTCFKTCNATDGPQGTVGPVTSNVTIYPSFNNGIFNLTGTATDQCFSIKTAKYYLGAGGIGYCDDLSPSTGTMDAADGSYDELIENLVKNNLNFFRDGLNFACIKSQNTNNDWGNCACAYFETDIMPPDCSYDIYLDSTLYPNEYLICGNNTWLNATVCDEQSRIQGGEYFIDLPPGEVPQGWTGAWMNPLYSFTRGDGHNCAIIGAFVNASNLSDGTHHLRLRGKDSVENWGKITNCRNVTFIRDTIAPRTTKTLLPNGTYLTCDITEANGKKITEGCYYVAQGTMVVLNATDPDPQGTDEHAGKVKIHYIVWWRNTTSDPWTQIESGVSDPDGNITITLRNDSYHLIEYWSEDDCGIEEGHHFELDIVDTTPPNGTKVIGEPKLACDADEGCDYWVRDHVTSVALDCKDPDPHPVGGEEMCYRISLNDSNQTGWLTGDYCKMFGGDLSEGWCCVEKEGFPYTFTFQEDSNHTLEYYCTDALGNKNKIDAEAFRVDSTPPVTNKTYGTPLVDTKGGYPKWINSSTPVALTAVDGGDLCAVGVNKTYWRNSIVDDRYCNEVEGCIPQHKQGEEGWNVYTGPFYKNETSCHMIEYWSEDLLGNREEVKAQCIFVDNEPPVSEKKIGEPKVAADCSKLGQGNFTDGCYYTAQSTEIEIACNDTQPHPVDLVKIYYKVDWKNLSTDSWTEGNWTEDSDYLKLTFTNDSYHRLTWYCTDALGNREAVHSELDMVDTTPPFVEKIVEAPKIQGTEPVDWYLTNNSKIILNCTDKDPHPVNDVSLYWELYWAEDCVDPEWEGIERGTSSGYREISNLTDSCHKLVYWCKDALGNGGEPIEEIDVVDNLPPVSRKEVGEPKIPIEPLDGDGLAVLKLPQDYYVTQATPITLYCNDTEPHPVDNVTIYWRYMRTDVADTWHNFSHVGGNVTFYYPEDSNHTLEWWCVDLLNNTESKHTEIDIVDTQPPEGEKIIGEPKIPIGNETCDGDGNYTYDGKVPTGSGATITPDKISLSLDPGDKVHEQKNISLKEMPIGRLDVLFLFDLTGSMGGVIGSAKSNAISIMNNVSGLVNDSAFGVGSFMDYPSSYNYCGYSASYGGGGDYSWSLNQNITLNTSVVNSAINGLIMGSGNDGPESYARALYESQFAGWREGSRKVVIIFEDSVPHDCNLSSYIADPSCYYNMSTGRDPGRDNSAGTSDDLKWDEVVSQLKAAGVSVITVDSGTPGYSCPDVWKYATNETGGMYATLGSSSELPGKIVTLIENVTSTIKVLTLEPKPGFEDWFGWSPVAYYNVSGGQNVSFDLNITVPGDAPGGEYHIYLKVVGDGSILAVQELWINVSGNQTCTPDSKEWWVRDHVTQINLTCNDTQPHPVGMEEVCYRISFSDPERPWLTDQYCEEFGGEYTGSEDEGWCCADASEGKVYSFIFREDSIHDLEYFCADGLNNTNEIDREVFKVDSQPPVGEKTVGEPKIPCSTDCNESGRTYTLDSDFDEGTLSGLEHNTVHDQLQVVLGEADTFPLMWIANAGEDSVSKWDTTNNKELARYHTWFGPLSNHGAWEGVAPSRTAVDAQGNVFVANRHFDNKPADVIKILADDYIDRNSNGVIDTSSDTNSDGYIQESEMAPAMVDSNSNGRIDPNEITDERVAWATSVGPNNCLGRALAIDLNGDVWLGCFNSQEYYKLDGDTGVILAGPISVSGHTPYGAAMDKYGILWGSGYNTPLLRIDTNTNAVALYNTPCQSYGIAVGYDVGGNTHVYLGSLACYYGYMEFNSSTNTFSTPSGGSFRSSGISVDKDGNIVASNNDNGGVVKFNPAGTVIWSKPAQSGTGGDIRGPVVDSNNDAWISSITYNKISKYLGSDGSPLGVWNSGIEPYTYSDATGLGLKTAVSAGTWNVVYDGGAHDAKLGPVSWNSNVPEGTEITVKVRSSSDQVSWSPYEEVSKGVPFATTPDGRYLEIQVFMKATQEATPVLYDLTVNGGCLKSTCWWVRDHVTQINLTCKDPQPHPVGGEKMCYRISFDDPKLPWLTDQYCEEFGGVYDKGWCCNDASEGKVYSLTFGEDSVHDLEYYCSDTLGNTNENDLEYFHVDSTPPESDKSVKGPVYEANSTDTAKFNLTGTDIETFWIRDHVTNFTIDAKDLEEPCDVGVDYVHIELWRANNTNDLIDTLVWAVNVSVDDLPYTFTINEDCLHLIKWYAIDRLGNKEKEHLQYHRSDSTPPSSNKTVDGAICNATEEDIETFGLTEDEIETFWVTSNTTITLTTQDETGICAVGVLGLHYEIWWDEDGDNITETLVKNETVANTSVSFKFTEDCLHKVVWSAVDKLGNLEKEHIQYHRVDNFAPGFTKSVGWPSHYWGKDPKTGEDTWDVTSDTLIYLNATQDQKDPCASGRMTIECSIWWDGSGEWSEWKNCTEPFKLLGDSTHRLKVRVKDCLGNYDEDTETFIVHENLPGDRCKVPVSYAGLFGWEWRSIDLPKMMVDIYTGDSRIWNVMKLMEDQYDIIYFQDYLTGNWTSFDPKRLDNVTGDPINSLSDFNKGPGRYYIKLKNDARYMSYFTINNDLKEDCNMVLPQCWDRLDNDVDSYWDYPYDKECTNKTDNKEAFDCGNGVKETGEECDSGAGNGVACVPSYGANCTYCNSTCMSTLVVGPYCGDGIKNGAEGCEDDEDCGEGHNCTACSCIDECVPNCTEKECGNDGCGGSCGTCETDYVCVNFQCELD